MLKLNCIPTANLLAYLSHNHLVRFEYTVLTTDHRALKGATNASVCLLEEKIRVVSENTRSKFDVLVQVLQQMKANFRLGT
jgi:hypothetical protein